MFFLVCSLSILYFSADLRAYFFANMFRRFMSNSNVLTPLRCNLLSAATGKVLEIGPGPGTNFKCWKDSTLITEWVGLDTNRYFEDAIKEQIIENNITFLTKPLWEISKLSEYKYSYFDTIVTTHVLCSVDRIQPIFESIQKLLKPGGTYMFMEHVSADPATQPTLHTLQHVLQPIYNILGNGCKFVDVVLILKTAMTRGGVFENFNGNFTTVDTQLSGVAWAMRPHLVGNVQKPW